MVSLEAEGGALITDSDDTARNLDVEVRVGSPKLDNTRPLVRRQQRPERAADPPRHRAVRRRQAGARERAVARDRPPLPRGDQRARLRQAGSGDAAASAPNDARLLARSRPRSTSRRRRSSSSTRRSGSTGSSAARRRRSRATATRGTCGVVFQLNTAYFVNSEGSQIQLSWTNAQLSVSVGVKADDGMNLSRLEQRFGRHARRPARRRRGRQDDQRRSPSISTALHDAPLAEPYVGPGDPRRAAPPGVFFHEVFGHRIEGHRQKDTTSGQTFASYVGKDIAPEWLSRLRRSADRDAQRDPAQRLLPLRRRGRARAATSR